MSKGLLQHEIENDISILTYDGSLELSTLNKLKDVFDSYSQNMKKKVVLDISSITYIDSSGIGLLIYSAKMINKISGVIKFVVIPGFVNDVLNMVQFGRLFEVHKNREDAIKSFD